MIAQEESRVTVFPMNPLVACVIPTGERKQGYLKCLPWKRLAYNVFQ